MRNLRLRAFTFFCLTITLAVTALANNVGLCWDSVVTNSITGGQYAPGDALIQWDYVLNCNRASASNPCHFCTKLSLQILVPGLGYISYDPGTAQSDTIPCGLWYEYLWSNIYSNMPKATYRALGSTCFCDCSLIVGQPDKIAADIFQVTY
jgi:hypothetical protein